MHTQRLWLRAQQHIADGHLDAAASNLQALLEREPRNAQARMLLSSVALGRGRLRQGCAEAIAAAQALPDDAEMIATVATCLFRVGETAATRQCMQHPEIARTRDAPALARLAHVWQMLGEHAAALALMDRARALGFDNPEFRYFRALQLQFNGRLHEAEREIEACLRQGPTHGRASLTLARLHRQTAARNHLDYIVRQLPRVEQGSEDHAAFEFARYKELEDLGRHDEAWEALQRGNAIMAVRNAHDGALEQRLFARLQQHCTAAFLAGLASDTGAAPQPIFILGLPRSGTTLLERLLGKHAAIAVPGELPDFPRQLRWCADAHGATLLDERVLDRLDAIDYAQLGQRYLAQTQWHAGARPHYVDKLPSNYMLAGLIHKALPRAPILHLVRAPLDVCFSNYRALFGDAHNYSYSLDTMAVHYRRYRALMAHWHAAMPGVILDVEYAQLVGDTEGTMRRVLAHCGLPFDAACTESSGAGAPVSTLSSAQVREPIHRRGVDAWRRYATQLEPLRMALADLA